MTSPEEPETLAWWHRRRPSVLVFAVVLSVLALVTVAMVNQVGGVLPEVPRDQLGEDRWNEPLGIARLGEFDVAFVPACAADPITRIVLWDADSQPYWEVAGPAKPMEAIIVGGTPEDFREIVPFEEPPPGEVLRLIAFRSVGGSAGIRYQPEDLKEERVLSGTPLTTYTIDGFKDSLVCSDSATDRLLSDGSDTTVPG